MRAIATGASIIGLAFVAYLAIAPSHAELVDPTSGRFTGRDAINERIAGFGERFPGARLTLTSGVDEHNGYARYAWTIHAADGALILEGIDIVERDDDDRLLRVIMFFGPLPAAE